ncbi:Gfo/Idh/MocA family oxidoreductase [Ramlibacter sp. USB13]|uniref:Gfo/Idh/MocA family oxidoreductase n=1 Tax=Ramlibacter cellulosilyticus TaxID=2764187 RepID=A0A923MP31_9BURK|nr:Gfo/Idh/MocA family oxidoreductase [Ramlibacter cellulosilyticus]MBC5781624.1 Gfo/Idh/MocA family oxidoreductase [Ramlibacter cellulosilyticus]
MTSTQKNNDLPRLGFLGLGWIGQHRMQALRDEQACRLVAVADPSPDVRSRARELVPEAAVAATLDELLQHELDGLVIATPSALHAQQSLAALERGLAVFCQKPLARTAAENQAIIDAARKADRLLGCDLSYRHTEAMKRIRNAVVEGELGSIYAVDLVFHNAYGPDKSWARDPQLAGGGCAIDLGIHLVDLALWTLGFPEVTRVSSHLYAQGQPLQAGSTQVEDYAVAEFELATGAVVRMACSWNLPFGRDAAIEAHFHGTQGGAAMTNVNGSFYDFAAARFHGTERFPLADPPDAWGGRAVVDWARKLAAGARYDKSVETLVQVAGVLDRVYGR